MHNNTHLLASDIVDNRTLLFEKSLNISGRGLASFPYDTEEDKQFIRRIARKRSHWEGRILELPNVPIRILINPLLSDDLIYYLALGDYEQSDMDMIQKYVKENDKVMDLGGGAGICAVRMGQCSLSEVVILEARDDLKDLIEHNCDLNSVRCHVIHGVVADHVPQGTMLEFTLCDNLWFSSLEGTTQGRNIQAPSITLEQLYQSHTPDVVLMDVEGAETKLNFSTTHRPRVLIVEIHTPSIGSEQTCKVMQNIIDAGYRLKDVASQTWVFEQA